MHALFISCQLTCYIYDLSIPVQAHLLALIPLYYVSRSHPCEASKIEYSLEGLIKIFAIAQKQLNFLAKYLDPRILVTEEYSQIETFYKEVELFLHCNKKA